MSDKILCVDDDLAILAGFQRQFRNQFQIVSGLNGPHALEMLAEKGPFAAVMSDYNMPSMNGLTFLRKVREIAPDSVRLMLTGKADAEAGLAAVNEGTLFRFLTKPCSPDLLANVFRTALEQHRLLIADRLHKQEIVNLCTGLLTEVQTVSHPAVSARVTRIQGTIHNLVSHLSLTGTAPFELAAQLSHAGCFAFPSPEIERLLRWDDAHRSFHPELKKHAAIGAQIIAKIPGLSQVRAMVAAQFDVKKDFIGEQDLKQLDPIVVGSQLLRLAAALDSHLLSDLTYMEALSKMAVGEEAHDPILMAALSTTTKREAVIHRRAAFLKKMQVGMKVPDDFLNQAGYLLAAKGSVLSESTLLDLQKSAAAGELDLAAER